MVHYELVLQWLPRELVEDLVDLMDPRHGEKSDSSTTKEEEKMEED